MNKLRSEIAQHLRKRMPTNSRYAEMWVMELEVILGFQPHDIELYNYMNDYDEVWIKRNKQYGSHSLSTKASER